MFKGRRCRSHRGPTNRVPNLIAPAVGRITETCAALRIEAGLTGRSFGLHSVMLLEAPLPRGKGRRTMRISTQFLAGACWLAILAMPTAAGGSHVTSATVPLIREGNAPIIEVEFPKPDGQVAKVRFVVDTGGGAFILSERAATEIGLKPSGPRYREEGLEIAPANPPVVRLGTLTLKLEGVPVFIAYGNSPTGQRDKADGLFPARLLRRYHVIFDYPAGTFTLAEPGTVTPRGIRLGAPIGPTGFPRIEAQISGQTYGFLLDTGATCTMISQQVLEKWSAEHPDWTHAMGAVGAANMFGGPMDAKALMLRVPGASLGSLDLTAFAAVGRPSGVFEQWMSKMMTAPIIGSIAGNVFRAYRVEIDYTAGAVYMEQTGRADPHDMDLVGLTLLKRGDGALIVSAVSSGDGPEVVTAIQPGDRLLRIDDTDATGLVLSAAADKLRGSPGEVHILTLERDGTSFKVKAPVVRLL